MACIARLPGNEQVRLAGSVTHLSANDRGAHVVTGSHGGTFVGDHALRLGIASLICHDAGIGLDEAGIAALAMLDGAAIPAAAVAHTSARIGEPEDMVRRGIVSRANAAARMRGVVPGMCCAATIDRLAASKQRPRDDAGTTPWPSRSHRHPIGIVATRLFRQPVEVVCVDSASEIAEADTGKIVITGSHGGLPGGDARNAIKARVGLAGFNDAGIGINDAGVARLRALDDLGVPAFAAAATSARIGDGVSTYETGIISSVNKAARALGIEPGIAVAALLQPVHRFQRDLTEGAVGASSRHKDKH